MKIPEKIQIAGKTFEVIKDTKYTMKENVFGRIEYNTQKIYLDNNETSGTNVQTVEQSLIHEILHGCFWVMGENELMHNEKVIDGLSELLYQVIQQTEGK